MTNYFGVLVAPLSLESAIRPCFPGSDLPSGSAPLGGIANGTGTGTKHGITAVGFASPWRLRDDRPMTVAPKTAVAAEPKTAQATPQGLHPISPG